MSSNILTISLETSIGNGEDSYLTHKDESGSVTIGVFDGLGGRSAGFDGQKGGRIASTFAADTAKAVLEPWNGNLTRENAIQLHNAMKTALKSHADANMPVSRLKGTLAGKRLCTTIALANISKCEQGNLTVKMAWMGDSRIYFLSENQGLQQLTLDDLEVKKDAFEMIREDPPMSKFISADSNPDWQINYSEIVIDEQRGCFLACTDGCFQYLSTPWDFERLLLETLSIADSYQQWQSLLTEKYQEIKQDDVSLLLYPIGFSDSGNNIEEIKECYKSRYQTLGSTYSSSINDFNSLLNLWGNYRIDYEERLKILILQDSQKSAQLSLNSDLSKPTEQVDNSVDKKEKTSDDKQVSKDKDTDAVREDIVVKKLELPEINRDKTNLRKDLNSSSTELTREISISYNQAQALEARGSDYLQESIQIYKNILDTNPDYIDVNFRLGVIYFDQGDYYPAIKYLENVQNLQTAYNLTSSYLSEAIVKLAISYYRTKRYDVASLTFNNLISHDSLDEYCLEMYADSLRKICQFESALGICDLAHHKYPKNPFILYVRGNIFHTLGYLERSQTDLYNSLSSYRSGYGKTQNSNNQKFLEIVSNEYKEVKEKLNNITY